jgi:hypothetical protein
MLITDETINRYLPHEPKEWMELRRLSAQQLKDSRKAKADEQREEQGALIKILGPEFLAALQDGDRDKRKKVVAELEELEYHLSNFDVGLLLKAGIVSWSYDGALPTDADPLTLVDERTATWAARELIEITRPPTLVDEGNS